MKKYILSIFAILLQFGAFAQCAMCTKTAAGLGDDAAEGLNTGIIFLAFTPLIIIGILTFMFYRRNKHEFA